MIDGELINSVQSNRSNNNVNANSNLDQHVSPNSVSHCAPRSQNQALPRPVGLRTRGGPLKLASDEMYCQIGRLAPMICPDLNNFHSPRAPLCPINLPACRILYILRLSHTHSHSPQISGPSNLNRLHICTCVKHASLSLFLASRAAARLESLRLQPE